jgi:hypothetical protein
MKWFNFSDKNYVKHIECLGLSREADYVELRKVVAGLRFQSTVIMYEPYKKFMEVQPYFNNLTKMASFEDVSGGEMRVKVFSHKEMPPPNLRKIVLFVMSFLATNAYVETHFSFMTCYWRKKPNQCNEGLFKAEIQGKMNYELSCKNFYSYVLQDKEILGAVRLPTKYSLKNSTDKQ